MPDASVDSGPWRFQPEELLRALVDGGVRFVLIGGLAATLHGSSVRTGDAEICPARDDTNLRALARVLDDLGAKIRAGSQLVDLPVPAELLRTTLIWNLSTPHGELDLSFVPAGTDGYDDLASAAVRYDLDGLVVVVASLDDVIRSKTAADRPKDREHLVYLGMLRDETERTAGQP